MTTRFGVREVLGGGIESLAGVRTADGSYRLVAALGGGPERGVHVAVREGDPRTGLLATVGVAQAVPHDAVRDALLLDAPGIAPLVHVGPVEEGAWHLPLDVLIEEMPDGLRAHEWAGGAVSVEAACAVGRGLAATLLPVHLAGTGTGGLRPEVVYLAGGRGDPRVTAICPRGDRFLETAGRVDIGTVPARLDAWSPAEHAAGTAPSPAEDVFAVACLVAFLATGGHPYPGADATAQRAAMASGDRRPWGLPLRLELALGAATAPDPRDRPSMRELADALS